MGQDGPASTRPGLRVAIVDAAGRSLPARGLAAWLARIAPGRARGTVTVALVSDARIRTLNRTYRGIDAATDVLSFPAAAAPSTRHRTLAPGTGHRTLAPRTGHRTGHVAPGPGHRNRHLGDIVIATGVARRQAKSQGHSEPTELRVLALHGLLHLLGYDHEADDGAMRRLETRLRRRAGLERGLIERGKHA